MRDDLQSKIHGGMTGADGDQLTPWWVDLLLLIFLAGLVLGVLDFGMRIVAPAQPMRDTALIVDLSPSALPRYALFSLSRGIVAYLLSLVFCLLYGTIAAKSRRAERFMIPILDILQGIPVLGFLPGLVLGMVALFPHSNLGLELACILMIFTAQVWNMAFSYYGSVRAVPSELREVSRVHRFGLLKTFRTVELPFGMISLIWNSMMSMAGGWFFLTVTESFRLQDKDFRLPGIGSYMSEAIDKGDWRAMGYALVVMVLMIVAVDRLLWRPLGVWAQRFKMDDIAHDAEESWVLNFLRGSRLIRKIKTSFRKMKNKREERGLQDAGIAPHEGRLLGQARLILLGVLPWLGPMVSLGLLAVAIWGSWTLFELIVDVSVRDWLQICWSLLATFLRTAATLLLGALWTVPVGIMIGKSPMLSRRLQPVVQAVASFPAPMIFPLVAMVLIKFEIDFNYGCVALMLLGSQWYILFNVISGAQGLPADLIETAKAYGVKGFALWKTLYLPAIFPALVTGLVTSAGGAWNASIVSEMVRLKGTTLVATGLGSLITKATEAGDFPLLCAAVLTMSVALVILNRLVWKRMFAFADRRFALNR